MIFKLIRIKANGIIYVSKIKGKKKKAKPVPVELGRTKIN